jgi:DNA-binding transcriptional LysR family regulator
MLRFPPIRLHCCKAAAMADLSWDDFRFAKAIAETRSLGGAAERLGVNHSTVFRRLAQIEQRLGSRLFERSRGGYALTPCGEEMVRLAERMGEDIVAFERRVTGHDLRPSGELRVTTNDTVLVHLLAGVLAGFRRAYPDIVLDVVVGNEELNLSKRDADVAVRSTTQPPETLIGRRVAAVGWAVFAPQALAGEPFDLAVDGRARPWVGFGDALAALKPARWLREQVGEEQVACRIDSVLGLAAAAAAGTGLALLPCYIGAATPGLVRLTAPVPELETGLWLLTHPDLRNTARVRAFLDFAATEIGRRKKTIEGME